MIKFQYLKSVVKKYIYRVMKLLPLKSNIVFECESDMSDNPYVFYQYLLQQKYNKKHKLIWIVKDVNGCKSLYAEDNVVFITRYPQNFRQQAVLEYYLSTSKWFIFSHPYWFKKYHKDQIVINTTHSVAQLKAPGNMKDQKEIDYILSCNEYCTEIKKKSFGEFSSYLELGIPRLDLLYIKDNFDYLNRIPGYTGQNIILSLTTFKQSKYMHDSVNADPYSLNIIKNSSDMNELNQYLMKKNLFLICKIHHLQRTDVIKAENYSNIVYLTDRDLFEWKIQLNQLLTVASALLTDYSSAFYDYLIIDRPIGFMISDKSEYTRGFIKDDVFDLMPGKYITSLDDLIVFLNDVISGKDEDSNRRGIERTRVFKYLDGNNCKRLYEWMKLKG